MKKRIITRPSDADSHEKILRLPRDNWSWGDYWMLLDGRNVIIAHQPPGGSVISKISIPRGVFNHFVKKYTTPVKARKP